MKRLKMLLDTVRRWWKPEGGTVSILDSTMARLRVKLSTGLIFILSPVVRAMSKIQLAAFETRSRAKVTIDLRRIQQIKPIQWTPVASGAGFTAQNVASWSAYNIPTTTAAFTFNSALNSTVLTITQDGDVIWNGKPSEAADILVRSFQMRVEDEKGVTKAAKRRYYALACRNILKQAEQMEYEEFLAFLNKEVYNRDRKVILDGLKNQSS